MNIFFQDFFCKFNNYCCDNYDGNNADSMPYTEKGNWILIAVLFWIEIKYISYRADWSAYYGR